MIDRLISAIRKRGNPTVVGLDPKLEYIPKEIKDKTFGKSGDKNPDAWFEAASDAVFEFNKALIDCLYDIVPAVKPQSAYYEMYGWRGVRCLNDTINYAKEKGMYVICDVKRGDIGATSEAYAKAYLGCAEEHRFGVPVFDADSVTVNPYLGSDGIMPFVTECEKNKKSIFVLVKTSNKSSGELQDLISGNKPIYEHMAGLVKEWGKNLIGESGYSDVGAVVGATYPGQAEVLRGIMPNTYFLVPGYGAQGGTAKDVAKSFNKDGLGAIVNASRSIMCAYIKGGGDLQTAARAEAIKMRDDIIGAL